MTALSVFVDFSNSARKIAGAFDLEKYYEEKMPIVFIEEFGFAEFNAFLIALYTGKSLITDVELCKACYEPTFTSI